jgi:SAM-dependent methyltransferase
MRWIRQRKFLKRRRILEEFSPHVPGRILDVGCSTGNFLYSMQEFGWEALGVETSAYAVRLARQQLGLEVFHGRLEDTHSPSGHFDVVTLWDVLEHTFDPVRTLQEVNRLLVEDGVVGLTVPNWDSLDRHLFGHAWIGYDPPRHLYVFPHSVMERMLEESGFRILRMWCGFGGYYTFVASLRLWLNEHLQTSWLRNALIKALYIPGTRFPFEPFFVLSDSLGFGGTLVVLAQKIGAASNEGT